MTEEAKSEATKETVGQAPAKRAAPRGPMARIAARVAFYLGVLSLLGSVVLKFVIPGALGVAPHTGLSLALIWLLMAATILLAEIERKTGDR